LATFFLWKTFLPFSEQKEEKQHWTTSKTQYVDTNSLQLPLSKSDQRVLFTIGIFFTTAHSEGKNERNVDKWKQRGSVPAWTVRTRVRNVVSLLGDKMHVITICKNDGISQT